MELETGGGGSGGGSINIFYKDSLENLGNIKADGGGAYGSGGTAGNGTISVGNISSGSYNQYTQDID